MTNDWVEQVALCMKLWRQINRSDEWIEGDEATSTEMLLRKRLIDEEHGELSEAIGDALLEIDLYGVVSEEVKAEILDGILDLCVVAIGTGLTFGFDLHGAMQEVFESNITKCPPPSKRHDGKVEKPSGWRKPELEKYIP